MLTAEQLEDIRQSWRPTNEKVDDAVKAAIDVAMAHSVSTLSRLSRN